MTQHNKPLPAGDVYLHFITHSNRSSIDQRDLFVGFNLRGDARNFVVAVSEKELLSFPRFQSRLLDVGAIVNHKAISGHPRDKQLWSTAIRIAGQNGQTIDIEKCGHTWLTEAKV